MSKNFKVADLVNGWESENMTETQAQRYIDRHPAPTIREVVPASAEWRFDYRFNEYAWFDGDSRIS